MEGGSDSKDLIPGLPDEVALLCLAWLPRRLHPLASGVSRSWKHAFQSRALLSLRRKLGIPETLLFLCLQGGNQDDDPIHSFKHSWWAIDPALCPRCDPLASPPFPLAMGAPVAKGEVLLAATASLYAGTSITIPEKEICRLDMSRKCWLCPPLPNMQTHRRKLFATASLDGYVYVAGGNMWIYDGESRDHLDYTLPLKSVERLDLRTMTSWERIPDMHIARVAAGAVMLNGCLHVIGGYNDTDFIFSGEIWDPSSQRWSLTPELWPRHIFDRHLVGSNHSVAVVMGNLFAVKQDWQDESELLQYENSTKIWTSLGCIPIESFCHDSKLGEDFTCRPFGIGNELWVVVDGVPEHDIFIIACSPLFGQTITWKRLPYSFHHFLLYLGVAVMI